MAAQTTNKPSAKASVSFDFSGKIALVTGSTSGIGYGIARAFFNSGATVLVNGRNAKTVDETIAKLLADTASDKAAAAKRLHAIVGDVADPKSVTALIAAVDAVGPLDFLINNVGIFGVKDFETVTDEEWERYYQTNVFSNVRLCRSYLPKMLKRNAGRIILVSSECGMRPIAKMIPYSTTKTAQIALARGMAELTRGTNVTVNSLLPGPTWTEGVKDYLEGWWKNDQAAKEEKDRATKMPDLDTIARSYITVTEPTSLIQRFGTVEEVAATALFLCTDLAAAINGSAQHCEGGIIRHI